MDKQEEIGRMYALRAGLSVISQQCDTYEQNKAIFGENKHNLAVKFKFKSKEQVEEEYQKQVASAKAREQNAQSELRAAEQRYNEAKKKKNLYLGLGIMFFVLMVTAWVGIVIFITTSESRQDCKNKENRYNECIRDVERAKAESKKMIAQAEEDRERNYLEVEEYQKTLRNFNELSIVKTNQQNAIVRESKTFENALKLEYSDLLDVRDWENLDLIIYLYETGRADSVKEALQLVDVERRNNQLVNAIEQASVQICNTMQNSIRALGKVLVAGFNSLSAQLEAQRVQTMGALQQISENISGVLTQQTLSNALLAKANVSSKEMVEQMKKLNKAQ